MPLCVPVQEAAVLSELEEKMRQSDKLLTHRQRETRELEDNVIGEVDSVCAHMRVFFFARYVIFL